MNQPSPFPDFASAYVQAIRLLTRQGRCRAELCRKLTTGRRACDAETAELVANRLEAEGWLNDLRYAQEFVRAELARRPQSRGQLAQRLAAKGVAQAIIADVLMELAEQGEGQTEAMAEQAARQALRRLGEVRPEARLRRALAFLARRGFHGRLAYDALRKAGLTWTDDRIPE